MPDHCTKLYFKAFVQYIRQISVSTQVSLEGRIEVSGFLIRVVWSRKAYFWSKQEKPNCRLSKTRVLADVLRNQMCLSLASSVGSSAGGEVAVGEVKVRKE